MQWNDRVKNIDSGYREMQQRIAQLNEQDALMFQVAMQHNNEIYWQKAAELEMVGEITGVLKGLDSLAADNFKFNMRNPDNTDAERELLGKLERLVDELAAGREEHIAYKGHAVKGGEIVKLTPADIQQMSRIFKGNLFELNQQYMDLIKDRILKYYTINDIIDELDAKLKDLTEACEELQGKIENINSAMERRTEMHHRSYRELAVARQRLADEAGHFSLIEHCKLGNLGEVQSEVEKNTSFIDFGNKKLKKFLNQLRDIGDAANSKETLLHLATDAGHLHLVVYLLAKGSDPSQANDRGYLPIHYAARKGHDAIASILLERAPYTVNVAGEYGRAPLDESVFNGQESTTRLLLGFGANMETETEGDNQTPLQKAIRRGSVGLVRILVNCGANPDVMAEMHIGKGITLRNVNLLQLASLEGYVDILGFLLTRKMFRVDRQMAEQMLLFAQESKLPGIVNLWVHELLGLRWSDDNAALQKFMQETGEQLTAEARRQIQADVESYAQQHEKEILAATEKKIKALAEERKQGSQKDFDAYRQKILGNIEVAKPDIDDNNDNTNDSAAAIFRDHPQPLPDFSALERRASRFQTDDEPVYVDIGQLMRSSFGGGSQHQMNPHANQSSAFFSSGANDAKGNNTTKESPYAKTPSDLGAAASMPATHSDDDSDDKVDSGLPVRLSR